MAHRGNNRLCMTRLLIINAADICLRFGENFFSSLPVKRHAAGRLLYALAHCHTGTAVGHYFTKNFSACAPSSPRDALATPHPSKSNDRAPPPPDAPAPAPAPAPRLALQPRARNSGRPAPGHRSASCLAATASIVLRLRHAQASARRRADPYAQRQQRKAVRRHELTELLHGAIAGWEVRNEIIWGYTC